MAKTKKNGGKSAPAKASQPASEQSVLAGVDAKYHDTARALGVAGFDWSTIAMVLDFLVKIWDMLKKQESIKAKAAAALASHDPDVCEELCALACSAKCQQIEALGTLHVLHHALEVHPDPEPA